jgi:glycosyltransferase involved in cell wall biosynthesis
MKILHLEASPGWGGQEIRILREAEGMRRRGHEVIFGVMEGGGLIAEGCKAGFTVYPLNFNKHHWPISLLRILSIIRRHEIDLVNTHSSLDAWIGGIAARIAKRPIVRTRHLSTPIKPGWNSRVLYGKLADFVVTTCASIIPTICSQSGLLESSCRSIPTGVDPDRITQNHEESEKIRQAWGIRKQDFLVGTVCFIRSWKGIADLLKAAHLLRGRDDIKWVIIGGGHDKSYRQMAADMHLDGIVRFTGHLENPFPALGALDLFALLSTAHEGVSQAILQAAFLEKPLIATPVGGLSEVCIDQVTGIQVPLFSSNEVALSVLKMKEEANLRKTFGQNGKKLVLDQFTLQRTLDQMESVYFTVMARKAVLF